MRERVAIGVGLALLTGCLSLPSSGEYATGVKTAEPVEAGTTIADAALDGASPADAGPIFACPGGALLCEDFEGSLPGSFASVDGAPQLSTAQAHSPTHALHAAIAPGTAQASVDTSVTVPAKVSYSFWFRAADVVPVAGYHIRMTHLLFGPACDWDLSVEVWLEPAGLQLGIDTYDAVANPSCGPVNNNVYSLLPASLVFVPSWHHVVIDVDNTKQQRRVTAHVDDEDATGQSITSTRSAPPTTVAIAVGIPCVQTGSGCFGGTDQQATYDVFIDDVTLVPKQAGFFTEALFAQRFEHAADGGGHGRQKARDR